jgi:branched-chain amino acid transport system substrate-binding protein
LACAIIIYLQLYLNSAHVNRYSEVSVKKLLKLLALAACGFGNTAFAAANDIVLGQSAVQSGPAAALGKEMRLGAEVYFNAINASGGVKGRKIVLRSLDDGYEPARAEKNTRELVAQDDVLALFGYVGTPTSAVSIPVATQAKVPFFGAFTGAELLRTPMNKYVYNVRASYFDETEAIIRQLDSLGFKKVAVFYQNDSYGEAGLKGVELALQRRNAKIHAKSTVERNSVDVAKAVAALAESKPEAVVMISAYKSCAAFIKAMKATGSKAMFFNVSFVGTQALANELGADAKGVAVSQVMPSPWSGRYPIVTEYQRAMKAAGQTQLSFTSLEGYVAAKLLTEALRRGGDKSREALMTALDSVSALDVGGMQLSYADGKHNASKYVNLTILTEKGEVRD